MININFLPFPNLETERLILRRIDANDVNEVFLLRSNEAIMKYIPRPLITTTEEAMEHINMIESKIVGNEGINWAITLKNDPKLIGIIGHYRIKPEHFRAEIGYIIAPDFSGKGIVSEAVKAVVDYGFDVMNLNSIEAIIAPQNHASEKVLLKNKFVKEAHLLENEYYNGTFLDTVIYSLLKKNR